MCQFILMTLSSRGYKVILAACSTFMRDQFLPTQSKHVRITILQSAEIGRKLLLSCYTGALEVKRKELLKYLTAASYLQMVHIVESAQKLCQSIWKLIFLCKITISMLTRVNPLIQMLRMKMKIQIKTVRSLKFQKIVL